MINSTVERRYITKLSPKEEAFVQYYLVSHQALDAYKKAGFPVGEHDTNNIARAMKLLKKATVSLRLKELQDATAEKEGITIQAVVANFVKVFEKAMSAPKPDFTNANRAMENLSRYLGMEVHRSETTQKVLLGHEDEKSIDEAIRRFANIVGVEVHIPNKDESIH